MKQRSGQIVGRVKANQTLQNIRSLQFDIAQQSTTQAIQTSTAPTVGQIISCAYSNGSGKYLAAGDELKRIGTDGWIIRAVANARSLAEVKPVAGQSVHCRFQSDPQSVYSATIKSVSRAGSRIVKHEALMHVAGGIIPVDPATMEATEPFFELSIELTESPPDFLRNGAVCEIRFEREYEPVGNLLDWSILRFVN